VSSVYPNLPIGPHINLAGTRLHEHIYEMCVALDAMTIALADSLQISNEAKFNDYAAHTCQLFNVRVCIPTQQCFRYAAMNGPKPDVWVGLRTGATYFEITRPKDAQRARVDRLVRTTMRTASIHFFMYYERYIDFVVNIANHNHNNVNTVWRFAKVVRNSIGHGDQININDKAFIPVSWHGLSYGFQDNGKTIMGSDLLHSDLIILMMEMDRELDLMGCPIEPYSLP
jgi:hypothetical protein